MAGLPENMLILAHLHIQDGRQNGRIMLRTAYFPLCSPQFLLYGSQTFVSISALGLTENH